jgi:hypothetical protein
MPHHKLLATIFGEIMAHKTSTQKRISAPPIFIAEARILKGTKQKSRLAPTFLI